MFQFCFAGRCFIDPLRKRFGSEKKFVNEFSSVENVLPVASVPFVSGNGKQVTGSEEVDSFGLKQRTNKQVLQTRAKLQHTLADCVA